MMHQRERDHEEILRRALRSAADLVEPPADGLERIRARLTPPRPAFLAWMMVGYAEAVKPLLGYLDPLAEWLRGALGPIIERFRPARPDAAHPQRRYAWLRPAAAMTTAVFVVAMGAFALTALPQVISQTGAFNVPPFSAQSGSHGASAAPQGSGSQFPGGVVPPGASGGSQTGAKRQTPGCTPSKGTSTGPAATPSTSASSPSPGTTSASPSASPSTSTSPSSTPSSTPTDTTTPSPSDSTSQNPAGVTPSPVVPAAGDTPAASPDPAAAVGAAVPAGESASPSPTGTPCQSTSSSIKKHNPTRSGSGLPAISHAKPRQGA